MKSIAPQNIGFTASTQTLNFAPISNFNVNKLYAVINVTKSQIIYTIGTPQYSYSALNGTLMTLVYNTTLMSNTDVLTVLYDYIGANTIANSSPVTIASDQVVNTNLSSLSYPFSLTNNSTTQLASGASFIGTLETVLNLQAAQLGIICEQPYAVYVDQFIDPAGAQLISTDVYTRLANQPVNENITLPGNYFRLRVTNNGFVTTTGLTITTTFGIMATSPRANTNLGNFPTAINEIGGTVLTTGQKSSALSIPVTLSNENVLDLYLTGQTSQTAIINNILPVIASANSTDVQAYRSFTSQIISTGTGGSFIFEGSNDNINFQPIPVFNQGLTNPIIILSAITATVSQNIYLGACEFRFIRLRIISTITGGSIQAFSEFSQTPLSASLAIVSQGNTSLPAGTNSIGSVITNTTLDKIVSGGTLTALNSTVVANTNGAGTAIFELSGSWAGSVIFEGSNNGFTTQQGIATVYLGGLANQSSTFTYNGFFSVIPHGFSQVRARMNTYISGTTNVLVNVTSASRINVALQGNPNNLQTLSTQGNAGASPWPVVLTSSPTAYAAGLKAQFTPYGSLSVSQESKVIFVDAFEGPIDFTNLWTQNGIVSQSASNVQIGNITTTNTVNNLISIPTFPPVGLSFLEMGLVAMFEANPLSTTNTNRFIGVGVHSSTPTITQPITNGFGFELDSVNGKLWASVWINGVRSPLSVDISAYAQSGTTRYGMIYRSDLVAFYIAQTEIPVASISFATPYIQTLPLRLQTVIGGTTPNVTPNMQIGAITIADSGGNATQLADGKFPFRKAKIDANGNLATNGTVSITGTTVISGVVSITGTTVISGSVSQGTQGTPANAWYTKHVDTAGVNIGKIDVNGGTRFYQADPNSTNVSKWSPKQYPYVELDPISLFYDGFTTLDTTNKWNTSVSNPPTATSGNLQFNAGTTANASSYLSTIFSFPVVASVFNRGGVLVTLPVGAETGSKTWWGFGIIAGAPTMAVPFSNAVVFEIKDTDGSLVGAIYSNSVRTAEIALVIPTQLSSPVLSTGRPNDGLLHRYAVNYRASKVWFEIDDVIVGSFVAPNPQIVDLPLTTGVFNGSSVLGSPRNITITTISMADTGRNSLQISDGVLPFRKATVSASGELSIKPSNLGKVTYSVNAVITPATSATDVLTITGSASKTVSITKIIISGKQTTAGQVLFNIIKRSSANSGGSSSAVTPVLHDSSDTTSTVTITNYTANPTSLGTTTGIIRGINMLIPATATAISSVQEINFAQNGKPIVLRGTSQLLTINLNAVTVTGGSININIEYTEE